MPWEFALRFEGADAHPYRHESENRYPFDHRFDIAGAELCWDRWQGLWVMETGQPRRILLLAIKHETVACFGVKSGRSVLPAILITSRCRGNTPSSIMRSGKDRLERENVSFQFVLQALNIKTQENTLGDLLSSAVD